MLTCKQVANALAEHRYWELPLHRRLGLQLHVALCVVCQRYNRQVMIMQRLADSFARREQSGELSPLGAALSAEAKARMRDTIQQRRGRPTA